MLFGRSGEYFLFNITKSEEEEEGGNREKKSEFNNNLRVFKKV
jgi:hypothetical protein